MKTYITGVVMKLDEPNSNGRIYSSEAAQKGIEKTESKISNRNLLSEILPTERNTATVNLDNVGGVVTELFIDETNLCAKVELIPSSATNSSLELLNNPGIDFMLSLKAYCQMSMIGKEVYVEDLNFISIDVLPFDNKDRDYISKIVTEE